MQDILIAIPALHNELCTISCKLLDPLQKLRERLPEIAYTESPTFVWSKEKAMQCYYDFQQNTLEYAKDKQGALQSFDAYTKQNSLSPLDFTENEKSALMEFMGHEYIAPTKTAENSVYEYLQQILILAYYKEEQFLELQNLTQKYSQKQEHLQNLLGGEILLDEDESVLQPLASLQAIQTENAEYLPKWQNVFPAFLAYTQQATAFFVTDKEMAKALCACVHEKPSEKVIVGTGDKTCACYKLELSKNDFSSYIPECYKEYCKQEKVCFYIQCNDIDEKE